MRLWTITAERHKQHGMWTCPRMASLHIDVHHRGRAAAAQHGVLETEGPHRSRAKPHADDHDVLQTCSPRSAFASPTEISSNRWSLGSPSPCCGLLRIAILPSYRILRTSVAHGVGASTRFSAVVSSRRSLWIRRGSHTLLTTGIGALDSS